MHHGLVALYSVQLQEFGYITLYPALAMAGAGQQAAIPTIMGLLNELAEGKQSPQKAKQHK